MWDQWCALKRKAWDRGRAEYRLSNEAPFVGDAALEAASEGVDFSNYVDQLHREQRCTDEEREHWEALMFEAFLWSHRVSTD